MKKKNDFPSREEIEEVLKEMEEDEKKGGLIRRVLPPHASHIDVLKEALCEEVIR